MNTMLFSVRPHILRLLEEGPAPLFWVPLPVPIPCPPSALIAAGLFSFTLIQILYSFSYFFFFFFFLAIFWCLVGQVELSHKEFSEDPRREMLLSLPKLSNCRGLSQVCLKYYFKIHCRTQSLTFSSPFFCTNSALPGYYLHC